MTGKFDKLVLVFLCLQIFLALIGTARAEEQSQYKTYTGIIGVETSEGVKLAEIWPGTPLARADLQIDDIITAVNAQPVRTIAAIHEALKDLQPYTRVSLTIKRSGAELEQAIILGGFIRLRSAPVVTQFVIPGVPQTEFVASGNPIDDLDNINVLKQAVIDPKTGAVEVIGIYDSNYATGPIPYLDLLKTALVHPKPAFTLHLERQEKKLDTEAQTRERMQAALKGVWRGHSVYLLDRLAEMRGRPEFERERGNFISAMADYYGITRDEYVAIYNYLVFDNRTGIIPLPFAKILEKQLRYRGFVEAADAYAFIGRGDAEQALRLLGAEPGAYAGNLTVQAHFAILAKMKVPVRESSLTRLRQRQAVVGEKLPQAEWFGDLQWLADLQRRLMPETRIYLEGNGVPDARIFRKIATGIHEEPAGTCESKLRSTDNDPSSQLNRIMYEADYGLKSFLAAPELFARLPNYTSWFDYASKHLDATQRTNWLADVASTDIWFEPGKITLEISSDRATVSFGYADMVVKALRTDGVPAATITMGYADHLNADLEQYARIIPSFHKLREAQKVIALARWIKSADLHVALRDVVQEKWNSPVKVNCLSATGTIVPEFSSKEGSFVAKYTQSVGGVSFRSSGWTKFGPASKTTETQVPDQLVLSSQLGQRAVQAANAGNLESARHLAELSAQALTGRVLRGDLAKKSISLPDAKPVPVSPRNVRFYKELLKETNRQIVVLTQNPSDAQVAAKLKEINKVYDQTQSNPIRAAEYLRNLQIRQALPTVVTKGGDRSQAPPDSHAAPPADAALTRDATYDCTLCDDGLRRNIRAKLDINPARMLGTYVDGSIVFYNNCKLKATKACEAGDQFVRQLQACDDRRGDEAAYFNCIRELFPLRQ